MLRFIAGLGLDIRGGVPTQWSKPDPVSRCWRVGLWGSEPYIQQLLIRGFRNYGFGHGVVGLLAVRVATLGISKTMTMASQTSRAQPQHSTVHITASCTLKRLSTTTSY